jgi:uncharacterized protein
MSFDHPAIRPELARQAVADQLSPLGAGAARLSGYLERDIDKCIQRWAKKAAAYPEFAAFFTDGRPMFALGELWGKAVRAGSLFYRYSADAELKGILSAAIVDLLSRQRSNGSISCSDQAIQPDSVNGDLWERKYVLLGMLNYYQWVEKKPEILDSLVRQMDCLLEQIGPAPKVPITESGWSINKIESSSLLEPTMGVYALTGDPRYLDFAGYIVESGGTKGYNLIEEAIAEIPPHRMAGGVYPKAYEMMSFFEGLVEYHRVTGDARVLEGILKLFRNIRDNEITVIGSGGGTAPHHMKDGHGECWDNTAVEQTHPDMTRMMETCVAVTWLKLCSQVLRLTGDVTAMDAIERTVYNALIGAFRASGDKFSYMNSLNGIKSEPLGWGTWIQSRRRTYTCCDLNGPMGLAMIPFVAVMQDASGPYVNLYNQGRFQLTTPRGQLLALSLESDYPLSGRVRITLDLAEPETFTIHLRIPGWSARTELRINDRLQAVLPGTYAAQSQTWDSGSTIVLDLDMRCRVITSRRGDGLIALIRGPVVLARDENLDSHYAEAVDIAAQDGFVEIVMERPYYDLVRMQALVPLRSGASIRMLDYASVDNWNCQRICTWLTPQVLSGSPTGSP